MPRANRYMLPGQIYHVTHRCHDRSYLLRCAKDRDEYRAMLRGRLNRYGVALLGYCLTSNHVHLLVRVEGDDCGLARFMQSLQGDFAQAYNLRKRRAGAFWSDRYHAVMVEGGEHLLRCLTYIDLNMVRAGVVASPAAWGWCGYQEVMGLRRRYRVLDLEALAEAVAPGHRLDELALTYREAIQEHLDAGRIAREARWTESLAVGGEEFIREIGPRIPNRMGVKMEQDGGAWIARETAHSYGRFPGPKNGSTGSFCGVRRL